MTPSTAANMRLLVIVSGDYGELGGAFYFLQGLGLVTPPTVLVPEKLNLAGASIAGVKVSEYRELADIEQHIHSGRVDAVMLFSGYLLTIGRRFSVLHAAQLLRQLHRLRIPVLTSDPFLGLLRRPSQLDFTPVLGSGGAKWSRQLNSRRLVWRLFFLKWMLRGCSHIYPSPISRLHGQQRARAMSYFNPKAIEADLSAVDMPTTPAAASWIFVLSQVDCLMQTDAQGHAFVQNLVERLRDVVRLERHPVLVAPVVLLDRVRSLWSADPPITLVHDETYAVFMHRLMSAELAFFWNYYSFSIIHRVRAHRPVMFFDEGHMVRIMPALHEAGVRLFYDGWRPPLLALNEPLCMRSLTAMATSATEQFQHISQGLLQCETPLALLQRAVSANQRDVLNAQT